MIAGGARASESVLDRLLGDRSPGEGRRGGPRGGVDAVALVQTALRRDIEALLNTRRPWRSVPSRFKASARSILSYGLADFAAGITTEPAQRERLRAEIERVIRQFEPRLAQVEVEFVDVPPRLDGVLALRISALLLVDPVPEPIAFETAIDTTTSDVDLRSLATD